MNSSPVQSSQTSIHPDLKRIVHKHAETTYLRPIPDFSRAVFEEILRTIDSMPLENVILDSCCGTGESTAYLASAYPHCYVVGLDKSALRTKKHIAQEPSNYGIWRANVEDVWRLLGEYCTEKGGVMKRHYCLYPNPYPKPHHILRRWHGHPLFAQMLCLATRTEIRTNWRVYAEEFAYAASLLDYTASLEEIIPETPISAFERKYHASKHTLYRVQVWHEQPKT
jgi:tRNA (guanine-N7-)-methyltransferase